MTSWGHCRGWLEAGCMGQKWHFGVQENVCCTIIAPRAFRTSTTRLAKLFLRTCSTTTRQGTEICNFGAPSPLEALHWIFCFFSRFSVSFSETSPLNLEKVAKNPVEKIASNPVTSVVVMVFSAPIVPLTAFKNAPSPNLSKICPSDCFWGFQSGGQKTL